MLGGSEGHSCCPGSKGPGLSSEGILSVLKGISVPNGHPALDGTLVPKRHSYSGTGDPVPKGCPVIDGGPILKEHPALN